MDPRSLLKVMDEAAGVLDEGSGMRGTFADFLGRAEKAFLAVAAKEIKKIAGGYAEKVEVIQTRPGGVVWLDYVGQDHGDIDLQFTASLHLSAPTEVTISWTARSATRGKNEGYSKYSIGQAIPAAVVRMWQVQFGM